MHPFLEKNKENIDFTLECPDKILIHGYLDINLPKNLEAFMLNQGLLFKDFKKFAQRHSQAIKDWAVQTAEKADRPFIKVRGRMRKDDDAGNIARRDGITEGLICVYQTLENCSSFNLAFGKNRPFLVKAMRKCLFFYFYFMDPDFGLIHVRIQSWWPFTVQIYIHGHSWLARQLDRENIPYRMDDNCFPFIQDPARAQEIAYQFSEVGILAQCKTWSRCVNPLLGTILKGQEYYFVFDQFEYSMDIVFKAAPERDHLYQAVVRHAMTCFTLEDLLLFLGRTRKGRVGGDWGGDYKTTQLGSRMKFRMGKNWIKMYDKSKVVLRIETVINDSRKFKVRRKGHKKGREVMDFFPMLKRVSHLPHYLRHAQRMNHRYLDALTGIEDPGPSFKGLEKICERQKWKEKGHRALQPLGKEDSALFSAAEAWRPYYPRFCPKGFGQRHGFTPTYRSHGTQEIFFQDVP